MAATSLGILDGIQSELLTKDYKAVLLGVAEEKGSTVFGHARCGTSLEELQDVADALSPPFSVLGIFCASRDDATQTAAELLKSGLCGKQCLALYVSEETLRAVHLHGDGSTSSLLSLETVPSYEEWLRDYRILRCELPVRLEVFEDGSVPLTAAIQVAVQRVVRQLDAKELSLLVEAGPSGRLLLRPTSGGMVDFLPGGSTSASAASGPSATSGSPAAAGVVQCVPLLATTQLSAPPAAPSFTYLPLAGAGGAATCRAVTLTLDALCFVRRTCRLGTAVSGLARALARQVEAAGRVLVKQGRVLQVRAYHFRPPGLALPLTLLYPTLAEDPERNDLQMVPLRQRLHSLFGLPPNRPLLRPANALELGPGGGGGLDGGEGCGEDGGSGGGSAAVARLRDVHLGLVAPNIGGTTCLVQGSYEYCHYMQDRFNDSGWGCAYRSLQTICSWFRLQKYTSKPIPSHKTIQQVLARLGDKPPTFVGSSNWIGAIELSYILDDYLGVTSRILTVNRGADIPAHARQLAAHFTEVGSPVMIGGGVLAYTLLGVRFNEQTGEAAFLILDPHYTGGEDLKKIQQGTWVGWKRPGDNAAAGGPLFVEDAFYNFLLPQRPNTV